MDVTGTSLSATGDVARPVLRVVRGVPDGVDASLEVAVLTAVLAARGGGAEPERPPVSAWNEPERLLHAPAVPGRDSWRASALPR